ncbi:cation:proton antiporter [Furfurilactobacillus sp. WILCCON 0119]
MSIAFAIGLLLIAVIAAEIVYNQFSAIPLAFYQILAGGILSLFALYHHYQFDPEIFLFGIIAPIMFNDAQETSRPALTRNIMETLSLAVMLVVATVVVVGFGVHWVYPALALSLAFMLIAIVSPTDATAVSSITKNLQLPSGLMATLKNESLFNDASGIVAFNLALTAFVSGNFSATHGLVVFLETFFGGLLVGFILGWMVIALRLGIIRWNIDNSSISVPIQLLTPFIIYWVAEELNVSGILAVVAAGLLHRLEKDQLRLTSTKVQIVTSSMWGVVTNLLNGFVFVLLGISLPTIVENLLAKHQISILTLVGLGVGIYLLMIILRYLWIRCFLNLPFHSDPRQSAALLSLSGVHGTVTLAMAFSIPFTMAHGVAFPMRNELIFISAVVILLSLVTPLFTIPFILPKQNEGEQENFTEAHHLMLDYAIAWLKNNVPDTSERHTVVETLYSEKGTVSRPDRKTVRALFTGASQVEADAITAKIDQGDLSPADQQIYQKYLYMITSRQSNTSRRSQIKLRLKVIFSRAFHPLRNRKWKRQKRAFYEKAVAEQSQAALTSQVARINIQASEGSAANATSAAGQPMSGTVMVSQAVTQALSASNQSTPASTTALVPTTVQDRFAAMNHTRQLLVAIEKLGNDAIMQWLYNQDISRDPAAINVVRDSYIKRSQHFRHDQDAGNEKSNALFISAFQAEYQYIQDALSREDISQSMAKSLRQQVSYDEMIYMQNDSM